jgi:O-antigen/teichoic acid export membrane protein
MGELFLEEDIKKVATGAGVTLIGHSLGRGLLFLSQIIIARFLGIEGFGLYALGFAAVKVCEIISKLGLDTGGMRFVSIYRRENPSKLKGVLISSVVISLLSGTFIGLTIYFLSGEISQYIFRKPELTEPLKLFALSIPFVAGTTVATSLMQGFHTTKYTVLTRDFILPITNIVLIIWFHYAGLGLSGVIYAFILSNIVAFIVGISYFTKLLPEFKSRDIKPSYEIKDLILYSTPLLFLGVLNYFLSWTDILMLGFLGSTKDVGIYRAASQAPFIMILFLSAVTSIYAPVAADLYKKGEIQKLSLLYRATTRWVSYAAFPIFVFLVFSAKEVMLLFGKEYVEIGYLVLIIVSIGQLINCITGGAGFTLIMAERQNIPLFISMASVVLNVILNFLLIPKYGSVGAALATSTAIACANITKVVLTFSYLRIQPFNRRLSNFIIFSISAMGILLFINSFIPPLPHYSVFIKAVELLLIFTIFFLFAEHEVEDKVLFQKMIRRS